MDWHMFISRGSSRSARMSSSVISFITVVATVEPAILRRMTSSTRCISAQNSSNIGVIPCSTAEPHFTMLPALILHALQLPKKVDVDDRSFHVITVDNIDQYNPLVIYYSNDYCS